MTTQTRELCIEFQPNLKNPIDPVPLGVLVMKEDDGLTRNWILLGREPRKDRRPPEFEQVTDLAFTIASAWFNAFVKDVEAATPNEDALARLCARWHWNLYATAPRGAKLSSQETILSRALKLYEQHIGEAFPKSLLSRSKRPRKPIKRASRSKRLVVPVPVPTRYYREELRAATM